MEYKIILKLVTLAITAVWAVTGAFTIAWAQESLHDLAERGVTFEAVYTGEVSSTVSGGLRRDTVYLDNVDLTLSVDAEKRWGWKGASFFIYGLGNHMSGSGPSDNAGDIQGLSNIDTSETWKIYEAWYQQNIMDDKLSILVGLYDLNSEFDAIETAGLFLGSSHGIGPDFSQSGHNGPSIFPTTSVGVRVRVQPVESMYVQAVVLDGVPGDLDDPRGTHIIFGEEDGVLTTLEIAYLRGAGEESGSSYGKYALGVWFYSQDFDDVLDVDSAGNPLKRSDNYGIYGFAEQTVYHEKGDDAQGLALFTRVGIANGEVNQFGFYLGAGIVYTGLFPNRDEDQIGLAVAAAYNGSDFKDAALKAEMPVEDSEVALELTYHAQIFPWLAVQPDVQLIVNPGMDPSVKNALVFGARLEISF